MTRAGKPGSRGRPAPRPVADLGRELGVAVHAGLDAVRALAPDLLVWAAFGRRIPPDLLGGGFGGVNVHASLLPRWRGPAPIQAAILAGDEETGVTLLKGDPGIDTGPLLASRSTPISPYDDATSLEVRLGELGGDLLEATLPRYLAGELTAVPQDDALATQSHRLTTEESILDFDLPARPNWRLVRAAVPRPVARTYWRGQPLLVWRARVSDKAAAEAPGRIRVIDGEVCVDTPERLFVPQVVQPAGKKRMAAPDWARGARLAEGARFPS